MHFLKSIFTLSTLAYSALAADCGGERFGGVTQAEVRANSNKIFSAFPGGVIHFGPNSQAVTFQTGECTTAIRHDQNLFPGNVDVQEILVADDQIEQACVDPNVRTAGGRGQGGEVTGIHGPGAADGTFTVTIFQSPAGKSAKFRKA